MTKTFALSILVLMLSAICMAQDTGDAVLESSVRICPETYYFDFTDEWKAFSVTVVDGDCPTQIWQRNVGGIWVDSTKDEYMQATCRVEYGRTRKGHAVQRYPKPEWHHCDGRESGGTTWGFTF
jgi:hypothetical protein